MGSPDPLNHIRTTRILLWALSRLKDGVDPKAVVALAGQLRVVAAEGLTPQNLLYALGALPNLPSKLEPELPSLLCAAAAKAAPRLTANKLGIAVWALSRPAVHVLLGQSAQTEWRDALSTRASTLLSQLGWRTIWT